jgi:Omp85 superfamily domain
MKPSQWKADPLSIEQPTRSSQPANRGPLTSAACGRILTRGHGLLFAAAVLFSSCPAPALGAEAPPSTVEDVPDDSEDPNRIETAVLPALAASSDIGFSFGAFAQFTRFDQEQDPHAWQLKTQFKMSVKEGPDGAELPTHDHFVDFDRPGLLGGRLRLYGRVGYEKNIIAGWYGLGNASSDDKGGVDRRFQFRMQKPIVRLKARIHSWHALSTFVGVDFRHTTFGIYDGSKLQEDIAASETGTGERLFGYDDHSLVQLQCGLIWDTRDNETSPLSGSFHEISARGSSGGLTGTDHDYIGFNVSTRNYLALAGEHLVVAVRLTADLLQGDVPFYLLGATGGLNGVNALGSKEGVRGVPSRRYNGKAKVFGNVELRSTFYKFRMFGDRFALGASTFFDTGRVWYDLDTNRELDGTGLGLKYGVGGGPQILWGKALVIRFDAAYSPDADPVGYYIEASRAF